MQINNIFLKTFIKNIAFKWTLQTKIPVCHSSFFFAESVLFLFEMFRGNTTQTVLANIEMPYLGIVTVTFYGSNKIK